MSIIQTITWKSLPIETYTPFTANFNAAGLGQYSFTFQAGNQNQIVIPINNRFLYLIDRVSFSADIAEGTYLESVDVQPRLRFTYQRDGQPVYPRSLPAINYKDNLELCFWFESKKSNDNLLVSMTGILDQVPATVGKASITAQLSLVIYQEENLGKIREMLIATGRNLGAPYHG